MKWTIVIVFLVLISACKKSEVGDASGVEDTYKLSIPVGFPEPVIPDDNTLTKSRIELGKRLFFENRLSSDMNVSCATCHQPGRAFSDMNPISIGVNHEVGLRNAPSLANVVYQHAFFAEGGVPSLELQAIAPLTEAHEMNMDVEVLVDRLTSDESYVRQFGKAYHTEPTIHALVKALASFQRTLISGNARYDQYQQGKSDALNAAEIRGMELFFSDEVGCASCHSGFLFTDQTFQNIGLYDEYEDEGRARLTGNAEDIGKFKVPSLRNIEFTGPYMHNGSMETLEEVVAHFNAGGSGHISQSEHIKPLGLSDSEQQDLVHFLRSLTDESFINNPEFQ